MRHISKQTTSFQHKNFEKLEEPLIRVSNVEGVSFVFRTNKLVIESSTLSAANNYEILWFCCTILN